MDWAQILKYLGSCHFSDQFKIWVYRDYGMIVQRLPLSCLHFNEILYLLCEQQTLWKANLSTA